MKAACKFIAQAREALRWYPIYRRFSSPARALQRAWRIAGL